MQLINSDRILTHLCGYEVLILNEVRARGVVISQRRLLCVDLGLTSPTWGRQCLRRLSNRGLIQIKRYGPRLPLVIRSVDDE